MSDDWGNRTVLEKTLQKEVTKLSAMLVESADMIERWKERAERLRAEVERLKAREITDEQIDAAWAIAVAGGVRLWDHSAAHAISALGIVGCPGCWSCMEHDSKEARLRKDCHGHGWIREEHGDE